MSEVAKKHYISEVQVNLQNDINVYCCSFNKILMKKKTPLQENLDFTKKFNIC